VKTGVHCPYCAADLYDPDQERCTQCGLFVPDDLRAVLEQKFRPAGERPPSAAGSPPPLATAAPASGTLGQSPDLATSADDSPPVAPVASLAPFRASSGTWQDLNLLAAQQASQRALWQRVWLQAGLGLVVWSVVIIPLGRWGGALPFSCLPAGLGITCCLFGISRANFWWAVAAWLIAAGAIAVAALL